MGRTGLERRELAAGAAALAVIAALAGCHAGQSQGDTVTGTLVRIGGPGAGSPDPLPGHVIAIDSGGQRVRTVRVGRNGIFRMRLAAGTYSLTGRSPRVDNGRLVCSADHGIHVLPTLPVDGVEVICSIR